MADEWTKAGHQTDFLAADAGRPQITSHTPLSRFISSDPFFDATKHVQATWRYFPAYGYRMLSSHWTKLPERYDVVIASTQLIVEVYAALVVARRQKAKLAVKVHHVLAAQQTQRTSRIDRLFLWSERRTMRWLNRHAGAIFTGTGLVSKDFHDLETKLGLPHKATLPTGYGVDVSAMPVALHYPKKYDLVWLGRLHEHKGAFDLPEVWRLVRQRHPQAKLLVIGEGPHRPRSEEMFREIGLSDSVTFTGGIEENLKNELLCQSRVGISLSYEEGWGLSINEFLAAGLPVVAYGLPVFDLIFPGQLVATKVGDKQSVAKEISDLLNDEPRRTEMGGRGRVFVERYDYRNVAKVELNALMKLF